MKNMKNIKFFTILFITINCIVFCSNDKQKAIDNYSSQSVKFNKKKITDSDGNYSIIIPMNWDFTQFNLKNDILLDHLYSEGINNIKVLKVKSNDDLMKLNESLVRSAETQIPLVEENFKMIDHGKTNILKYTSYFYHTSQSTNYETMSFLFKGKQENVYYRLIISGESEKIAIMIKCLKNFEILK